MNRYLKSLFVPAMLIAALFVVAFSNSPDEISAIGTRTILEQAANQAITASTTPVASDLTTPVAANQKVSIRYAVPFTLAGTASGVKFLVNAPTAPTAYVSSVTIFADDNSVGLVSVITSEAAQGVTLANAGNHVAIIDVTVENGSTAGNVALEFAQNVSDAGAVTVLRGATAEITKY